MKLPCSTTDDASLSRPLLSDRSNQQELSPNNLTSTMASRQDQDSKISSSKTLWLSCSFDVVEFFVVAVALTGQGVNWMELTDKISSDINLAGSWIMLTVVMLVLLFKEQLRIFASLLYSCKPRLSQLNASQVVN